MLKKISQYPKKSKGAPEVSKKSRSRLSRRSRGVPAPRSRDLDL